MRPTAAWITGRSEFWLDPGDPLCAIEDGTQPAEGLLEGALAAGAAAVLPWGLGKWLGRRGRQVARLARDDRFRAHPLFFLGDIAQRPWPWPEPALFAEQRVLPGSDPLAVAGAERRVGRYGFRIDAPFDPGAPTRTLLEALSARTPLHRYGRRESWISTLREQLSWRP